MTVSARERHALDEWFREQMGPERARTLMQLLPQQAPQTRWWWATDPRDSFWVKHGTGFFIGQAFGTTLMLLVVLISEAA